ncbi:MAG TPA: sulfotransferase [Caulobacteraceae bacterium]|jgi:Tfp pilus assembly protein PilF|nr:sulfotransferase [Caulobacteraceae bacterium]
MSTTRAKTRDAAADAATLRDVNAALAASDLPRAIALAKDAVAGGLEDPLLYNLISHDLEEQGRHAEALAQLERARELAPQDVLILNAIGLCLMLQDRPTEAINVYDAALRIDPERPQSHYNRADALATLGDFELARRHYEYAVHVAPDYAGPIAGLASLALRRGDIEAAKALSERALTLVPNFDLAVLTYAETQIVRGEPAEAEARLAPLLAAGGLKLDVEAKATSLLGDAFDAEGRFEDAFAAYAAASDRFRRLYAPQYADAPNVLEMARWLLARFEAAEAADWMTAPAPPPAAADDPAAHIFFVGFPRSGTTLLEQILASHPDIVTLDEREVLVDSTKSLFVSDQALDRLSRLGADEAAELRQAYWRRARDYCPDLAGRVFIDKLPLNSVRLPLIAKLFPNAKVLFALRDPRDVVLSCFRRRFGMNAAMHQLLTLDGAAAYYDAVMRLVDQYAAKLPLSLHQVRYETLVEDLRGEAERVCGFIGVAWDDSMLDFAETARSREIRTPSARQVRRGLYSEGVDQWRAYAAQMAPVMPLLAPWVEKFGYPAE